MLKIISMYNFAFFGGWREPITLDGHFAAITDGKEFVFYKVGEYGGFTWIKETHEEPVLEGPNYRYAHDAVLQNKDSVRSGREVGVEETQHIEYWNTMKHYKLHEHNISANIYRGDWITDLETGKEFQVEHWHDLRTVTQNFHYKLRDRELHPAPMTREEFIDKLKTVNVFSGWSECDWPKKGLNNLTGDIIIDGVLWKFDNTYNPDIYYIQTPKGKTWKRHSSVSAPFYDAMDLITGKVFSEYDTLAGTRYEHCIYEVINDMSKTNWEKKIARKFKLFNEPSSYHYNTRCTKI